MVNTLTFLIIGIFVALLFLNIYFRVKILKVYKTLVQNKVEFNSSHIFNKTKLENEILPKYPKFSADILTFTGHIKNSIFIAIVLVVLITIMGVILKNV